MLTKQKWQEALSRRHGIETQNKFENATVAICGLGGLGSNIAISLARAGVGTLILIDFDKVDITNLHRQQYKASQIGMDKTDALKENLLEINPFINLIAYNVMLDENNVFQYVKDADIICEAFDKAENKAMLVNCVLDSFSDKKIVSSSGMAGFGDANEIKTTRINERFYLCGDRKSDVNFCASLVSARVMLCASHAALKILQIIKET